MVRLERRHEGRAGDQADINRTDLDRGMEEEGQVEHRTGPSWSSQAMTVVEHVAPSR